MTSTTDTIEDPTNGTATGAYRAQQRATAPA